jgi:hypothetical protein
VITKELVAGVQGAGGASVVSVRVTEPAAISAAPGVYTAFNTVALGENVPSPEVVQVPFVAPPPIEPFRVTV